MRHLRLEPIAEALERWIVDHPHHEAIWSRGEGLRLSFEDLEKRIASRRRQLGPLVSEVIALATGNRVAFVELFFALRRLGVAVALIDGALPHDDKIELCRRLGIPTLLHVDLAGECLPGDAQIRWSPIDVDTAEVVPGTAVIKLTSGSTGQPAGVCYDEATLHTGIRQIGAGMALDERDRVLISIPLSHSYGFDNGLLSLAVLGTPLVLEPSIYPQSLLRAIFEANITCLPLVPPLVRSLGQMTWSACPKGLRRVISAGGPLSRESAQRFLQASGVPIHNFYGSTETGGIAFESQPLEADSAGTVGHPLPGVEIEFEKETRAVIVHSAANHLGCFGSARHEQRPVRTGDTAERTPNGRLRLTGRSADFLNIGGCKVAAARLEEMMRAAHGVEDAAVVGLEDEVRGDRVIAFVVAEAWPPTFETVPNRLRPRKLHQVSSLPYNARGKLDRRLLRQMASEA